MIYFTVPTILTGEEKAATTTNIITTDYKKENNNNNNKNIELTNKGDVQRSKYATQAQQQRPESSTVTHTWHACKYKVHKLHQRYTLRSFVIVLVLHMSSAD